MSCTKREELMEYEADILLEGNGCDAVYLAGDADSVMDALEARIKELEEENIAEDVCCCEENVYHPNGDALEAKINRLYSLLKELHNENKALRHNLEDYKCENEALKARIKELEVSQPKWISVEDKMPKDGMLIHKYDGKDVWIGVANRKETNIFTHWMPLPQQPKSED